MANQRNENQIGKRLWQMLGASLILGFVIRRVLAARSGRMSKSDRDGESDHLAVY